MITSDTDDKQTTEAVVSGSLSRWCFFSFRTSQPCVDVCPSTVWREMNWAMDNVPISKHRCGSCFIFHFFRLDTWRHHWNHSFQIEWLEWLLTGVIKHLQDNSWCFQIALDYLKALNMFSGSLIFFWLATIGSGTNFEYLTLTITVVADQSRLHYTPYGPICKSWVLFNDSLHFISCFP